MSYFILHQEFCGFATSLPIYNDDEIFPQPHDPYDLGNKDFLGIFGEFSRIFFKFGDIVRVLLRTDEEYIIFFVQMVCGIQ